MSFDEFFTDGDKPYSENLNDGLALVDAFDLSVPVKLPDMFSNGEFSSSVNVARKCGVGIVTLMSVDGGVTIGPDGISGSGSLVFRVYPNFNSFFKWDKLILEKTGSVSVGFRKVDGSEISASVGADGVISDSSALKVLQEIDVVFTLSSASVSSICFWFVNNQSSGRVRSGALLEASQLANVNGEVVSGEVKAVNGGTVYNAIASLEGSVNNELEDLSDVVDTKEDKSNKVTSLDNSDSHYPSSKAVKSVTDGLNSSKENVSNKVTSLDSSNTHYPSSNAVKSLTDKLINVVDGIINETLFVPDITISRQPSYYNVRIVYSSTINKLRFRIYEDNTLSIDTVLSGKTGDYNKSANIGTTQRWIISVPDLDDIIIYDNTFVGPSS